MKCYQILSAGLLFTTSIHIQVYASVHPTETVCKSAAKTNTLPLPVPQGYVIVGETHDISCTGGGQNAWLTKVLEPGDTICSAPHRNAVNKLSLTDTFDWRGYVVIGQSTNPQCPVDYTPNYQKKIYNAVTLTPVNGYYAYNGSGLYPSTVIVNRLLSSISATTPITSFFKQATSQSEIACVSNHMRGYLITAQYFSYSCDKNNTMNTYALQIPSDDTVYNIRNSSSIILYGPINTVVTSGLNNIGLATAIKPSASTSLTSCIGNKLPHGYREVAVANNPSCSHFGSVTPPSTLNQVTLKKVTDNEEFICATNKLQDAVAIPHDYILVENINLPACGVSPTNNAYKIRQLLATDTVCKDQFRAVNRTKRADLDIMFVGEDDYGIVGETTLASCGVGVNNAWSIKRLADSDTICQTGFDYRYYPDYVIDSVASVPSCPGIGNNALNLRRLQEPEDVFCLPVSDSRVLLNYQALLNKKGFISQGYTTLAQCGSLTAERYRLR